MEIIHQHFESLASTNDWAKGNLKNYPKGSLLFVTADGQTAARGQYGRRWFSPKGENIYATFAFFSAGEHDPLSLTHVLAISACRLLKTLDITCQIKWPNDLLVKGRKIGGILCEKGDFGIVIGIGLNVNMSKESLQHIDQPATSLLEERGEKYDLPKVLSLLKDHFAADLEVFFREGFVPFTPLLEVLLAK